MVEHAASTRSFPDIDRELNLRAGDCMKLLIISRKKQQRNPREELRVQYLGAQALDADGLGSNPAPFTDQLYVLSACLASLLIKYDVSKVM